MEDLTPQQLKGFNGGYLLAKQELELFAKVMKSLTGDSEYTQGLKMGKKQHDKEILLVQMKQSKQISKAKDKER